MSKLPLDECNTRLRTVRRLLRRDDCDALLVTNLPNVRYLCDYEHEGTQLLVTARKVYLLTRHRGVQKARKQSVGAEVVDPKETPGGLKALAERHHVETLGFDVRMAHKQFLALRKRLRPARLKATTAVREARGVKSDREIRLLARAQREAEAIFDALCAEIRPGMTEHHVHNRILQRILDDETLDGYSFEPIACAGPSSWTFHSRYTGRKLRKGDCLIIDMGVRRQGYCSDMTRTVFLGQPAARMREVYGVVRKAQERAIALIRAGADPGQIAAAAWDVVDEAGYAKSHGLGHGVGLETHDPPVPGLGPKRKEPLEAGMVFTVEPGIYLPHAFGVRLEDTVVVTPTGCRNLTRTSKEVTILD